MRFFVGILMVGVFVTLAKAQQKNSETIICEPVWEDEGKVIKIKTHNSPDSIPVYTITETQAEPIGGMRSFYEWMAKNLHYPEKCFKIEGTVFIQFIIENDGRITNAEVVRSLQEDLDKEALRVISLSPKWKPARMKDEPVRSAYILPITFKQD